MRERQISPLNQASSPVFSNVPTVQKRPPRPGAALCSLSYSPFGRIASGLTSGLAVAITQGWVIVAPHERSAVRPAGRCPLPPGASSIDLEDSEHLMQPDQGHLL